MDVLTLDIYFPCCSAALIEIIRRVSGDIEGAVLRLHEEGEKTPPPSDGVSQILVITDDADEAEKFLTGSFPGVCLAYAGDEDELTKNLQNSDSGISSLDDIDDLFDLWNGSKRVAFHFKRLIDRLKSAYRAWFYQNLFTTMIDSMGEMVWYKGLDGAHWIVNDAFCKTVGKSKAEIRGKFHKDIWGGSDSQGSDVCMNSEREVIAKRRTCLFKEPIKTREGMRMLNTYKTPVISPLGQVIGTVGIAHNVTDLVNLMVEITNTPFPLVICDTNWHTIQINNKFRKEFDLHIEDSGLSGFDYQKWKKDTFRIISPSRKNVHTHTNSQELSYFRSDTHSLEQFYVLTEQDIVDPAGMTAGYYCYFRNVTTERLYESKLIQITETDELTQLFNRQHFYSLMLERESEPLTLLYFHVSNLNQINSTYGHARGDFILQKTAELLKKSLTGGITSRISGSEFTTVMFGMYEKADIEEILGGIRSKLMKSFESDFDMHAVIQTGFAQSDGIYRDADDLIRQCQEGRA